MKQRFVEFMRGTSGRLTRGALGLSLIALGLLLIGGTAGSVVAAFGLLPLASGATGICPLGPAFGVDFRGRERSGSACS